MHLKTIATIGLPDRLADFAAVMRFAARYVEEASIGGADLVVLPETINLSHRAAHDKPLHELALDEWRHATSHLREAAARHRVALVLPLLVRDAAGLANRFYLLGRDGEELGTNQTRVPAAGEQDGGVQAAEPRLLTWEGLRMGGAICIDVYFPHLVLDPQAVQGANLFVLPSMTPSGTLLDGYAAHYGVPFVLAYSPWSRILDRDGRELAAGGYRSETLRAGLTSPVQLATINFNAVTLFADINQERLPDVACRYGRDVRIRFDQHNCNFVLESLRPEISVPDIMREFGLVSRQAYLASLAAKAHAGPGRKSSE